MEFHGSQDLGLWWQITLSCCGKVCLPLAKTLFFSSWLPSLFGEKVSLTLPAYPSVLTENTNSKTFPVVDHVTSRESEVIQKTFAIKKLMSLLMFWLKKRSLKLSNFQRHLAFRRSVHILQENTFSFLTVGLPWLISERHLKWEKNCYTFYHCENEIFDFYSFSLIYFNSGICFTRVTLDRHACL